MVIKLVDPAVPCLNLHGIRAAGRQLPPSSLAAVASGRFLQSIQVFFTTLLYSLL